MKTIAKTLSNQNSKLNKDHTTENNFIVVIGGLFIHEGVEVLFFYSQENKTEK